MFIHKYCTMYIVNEVDLIFFRNKPIKKIIEKVNWKGS